MDLPTFGIPTMPTDRFLTAHRVGWQNTPNLIQSPSKRIIFERLFKSKGRERRRRKNGGKPRGRRRPPKCHSCQAKCQHGSSKTKAEGHLNQEDLLVSGNWKEASSSVLFSFSISSLHIMVQHPQHPLLFLPFLPSRDSDSWPVFTGAHFLAFFVFESVLFGPN